MHEIDTFECVSTRFLKNSIEVQYTRKPIYVYAFRENEEILK